MHLCLSQKPFLSQSDAVDKVRCNWHHQRVKFLFLFPLLVMSLLMTSCRKKDNSSENDLKKKETKFFETAPEAVSELSSNRLANEPSDFLQKHADSPIRWQPWSLQVLEHAEKSQRLIFVFVGSTLHPQSSSFAKLLEDKFAEEINEQYLPVMADTEASPALTLACNLLATERKDSIAFPYLLWLSHEGHPVAWIPVSNDSEDDLLLGFRRAQNTVRTIQEKSARYVVENSRYDNEGRINRIYFSFRLNEEGLKKRPKLSQLFIAAQDLADLYDSVDQTFDNTGGIPPGNLITTLARVSNHPSCPNRLENDSETATRDAVAHLAQTAIRDPLDGYFFARRNSRSFAVPALSKTLITQAEMLSAMASSPPTASSQLAVQDLLEALKNRPLQSQALTLGETYEMAYFWNTDSLADILNADELAVAKAAFDLRGLGNIPSADDPNRNFFRRNTLGLKLSGSQLARTTGKSEAEANQLLRSATQKLATRREEILSASGALAEESMPVLSTQARLLTALVRTQAVDPSAEAVAATAKVGGEILSSHFSPEGELLRVPARDGKKAVPATGYDYVATIEAFLEWYRLSWNPELLEKSELLATQFLDDFIDEKNYPVEVPIDKHLITFPIYNNSMVFGPSTWGTAYGVLRKLSFLGFEHPKLQASLEAITPVLEVGLESVPVIHTDYLLNAINTVEGYLLVFSPAQRDNETLRRRLAQSKFDSVFSVVATEELTSLAPNGENAAVLLRDGKQVATFSNANDLPGKLLSILSK